MYVDPLAVFGNKATRRSLVVSLSIRVKELRVEASVLKVTIPTLD